MIAGSASTNGMSWVALWALAAGEPDGEGEAVAVDHEVELGAGLTGVDRVRTGPLAPRSTRMLGRSTLARDRSMAASSPGRVGGQGRSARSSEMVR
jgi:hypothetical protein